VEAAPSKFDKHPQNVDRNATKNELETIEIGDAMERAEEKKGQVI